MDRRVLLAMAGLGAAAPMLGRAAEAGKGAAAPPPGGARLLRVYAGPDGESHMQELIIPAEVGPLPMMKTRIRPERAAVSGRPPAWHNSPGRVFAINLTGDLDCQTSDGSKGYVPTGGIVFLEDSTGKGHITMPRSPVTLLFLEPPADFDVVAWCRGAADKPKSQ